MPRRSAPGRGPAALLLVTAACCAPAPPETAPPGVGCGPAPDVAGLATLHLAALPLPFVHPLRSPEGVELTRAWPMDEREGEERDHPHHRSLWLAHGDVDGHDFWHGGEDRARIELEGEPERVEEADTVVVRAAYRWVVGEGEVLLRERREWRLAVSDDHATVDLVTRLEAVGAARTLGDTKEGSFAVRVRPELRVEGPRAAGRLTNSEGDEGRAVWGRRARWIHDQGEVEGRVRGVALLDAPSNPSFPTWWHARTYGLLAANPFGRRAFEGAGAADGGLRLEPGTPLGLAYRVVLHDGAWDAARVEEAWQAWAASRR
jgi:hypothetical protein